MEALDRLLEALRPERLIADLQAFRVHGAIEAGGVERPALGPADVAARRALLSAMKDAGLRVETDAIGNVWGRLGGDGRAVVAGSHLDSVPRGGYLDGPLGVLAALEVARAMKDSGLEPAIPYEVVSFTGEEGSRFPKGTLGSAVAAGSLPIEAALGLVDAGGVSVAAALKEAHAGRLAPVRAPADRLCAYLELHIEQGGVLEAAGVGLGVVRAIAGLVQLDVEVVGVANHAGTTPMDARSDALAAAAEIVVRIEQRARLAAGAAVATVGRLAVSPGAWNIVPGSARFGVDIRSADAGLLETMEADIRRAIGFVCGVRGVAHTAVRRQRVEPGLLDPALVARAAAACARIGEASHEMNSGAVHDALEISRVAPAAMLFVPSVAGKSHTPEEETRPEDVARGLRALAALVWDLCSHGAGAPEAAPAGPEPGDENPF
jgi:hydantoinase/carbamoylase family amidase